MKRSRLPGPEEVQKLQKGPAEKAAAGEPAKPPMEASHSLIKTEKPGEELTGEPPV